MTHCATVPALVPIISAAIFFLAGCSSSSDSTPSDVTPPNDPPAVESSDPPGTSGGGEGPTGDIDVSSGTSFTHVGYIALLRTSPVNSLFDGVPLPGASPNASASASLTRLPEPFTLAQYLEARAEDRDRCTRYVDNVPVEGALVSAAEGPPMDYLSGGEVLTIQSPQGSYAELIVSPNSPLVGYTTAGVDSLPLPVPDGLIADIPGAEFPAVSDIVIPDAGPLVVLGDSLDNILSREFRWETGADPSSVVMLSITTNSLDGSSNGFLCTATDDGEFVVPEWAVASLSADAFTTARTLQRETYALTVDGNTLVVGSNLAPYSSLVTISN